VASTSLSIWNRQSRNEIGMHLLQMRRLVLSGFAAAATGTTTPIRGSSVRASVSVSTAPISDAAVSRAVRLGRFHRVSTVFRIDV
jgi:hypothetical protein